MTINELDIAVARTKHERLRYLTSLDNPDEASREAWRRKTERIASELYRPETGVTETSVTRTSVTETMERLKLVKTCQHLVEPTCGCNFGRCSLYDKPTSYPECIACGLYAEKGLEANIFWKHA